VLGAFVAEKIRAKIGAAIGQIEPAGMAQLATTGACRFALADIV